MSREKKSHKYDPVNDYTGYDTRLEWSGGDLASLIAAGALPRGRALDLGCGHGTEALLLAVHGWEVLGLDVDKEALAAARRRAKQLGLSAPKIRFVRGSALARRVSSAAAFDLVVERLLYSNFFSDSSFPRPRKGFAHARRSLLKTIVRCTRPGGVAVMRFPVVGASPKAGRVTPALKVLTGPDQEFLRRYFVGPLTEVAFVGVAGATGTLPAALVASPVELSITVMKRNEVPAP